MAQSDRPKESRGHVKEWLWFVAIMVALVLAYNAIFWFKEWIGFFELCRKPWWGLLPWCPPS